MAKKTSKKSDPNKPLVEMTKKELADTFEELGRPFDRGILNDARRQKTPEPVCLALAVLTLADGQERIAYDTLEYGDDEGFEDVSRFVRSAGTMLRKGESIRLAKLEVQVDMTKVQDVMPESRVKFEDQPWKLYWCETEDHDEDWFVIARHPRLAAIHHENAEGYDRNYATATFVADVPRDMEIDVAQWPSDEQIIACGGEFVQRTKDGYEVQRNMMGSGGRIVKFGDKFYAEGDIARNCAAELGQETKN